MAAADKESGEVSLILVNARLNIDAADCCIRELQSCCNHGPYQEIISPSPSLGMPLRLQSIPLRVLCWFFDFPRISSRVWNTPQRTWSSLCRPKNLESIVSSSISFSSFAVMLDQSFAFMQGHHSYVLSYFELFLVVALGIGLAVLNTYIIIMFW